jgi:hypothetical protein
MQSRSERRKLALQIKNRKRVDINDIKYGLAFEDIIKLIKTLPIKSHDRIFTNPLPYSLSDLYPELPEYYSDRLLKEIDWYVLRSLFYCEEINDFLALKLKLEIALLKSDLSLCESILKEIEDTVCYSYWGLQVKLLITELKYGTESNRKTLTELAKLIKSPNIKILLQFISIKNEKDIPAIKYDSYVELNLKKNTTTYSKTVADYVKYKLNPRNKEYNLDFGFILCQDSYLSVIDSYLELKDILSILLANKNPEISSDFIKSRTDYLKDKIEDNYWANLGQKNYSNDHVQINNIFKNALILFIENKSNECINLISKELEINPHNYNLYQIFTEVLNYENKSIEDFINKDSILYIILTTLLRVIKKSENHNESIESLNKLAYIFNLFDFTLPLGSILDSEFNTIVSQESKKRNFLLNYDCSINDTFVFEELLALEKHARSNHYFGKKLYIESLINNGNFREALVLLYNHVFESSCIKNLYYETWLNRKKIHCHIKLNELIIAAELIVKFYFKHGRLFESLISDEIVDRFIEEDGNKVYENIVIPILFTLYNLPSSTIYDSIANFLIQNNVTKPSELYENKTVFNLDWYIYFLNKVCTISNIQDSPYFSTLDKVEKERISILAQLKELRPYLSEEINDEIFDITQKATVRFCLQNIYDSRIYVETSGVKKLLLIAIADYFERYQNIWDLTVQDLSLLVFNKGQENESSSKLFSTVRYYDLAIMDSDIIGVNQYTKQNEILVPYSRYLAFWDIFETVKNEFLFNPDYGLKFFLSMRIRHGTLPNFLKNVFEKHSLILNEGINKERIINFWKEKTLEINMSYQDDKLVKILENFTLETERITAEGVSWVKIKEVDSDLQSILNYDFSGEMLNLFTYKLGYITDLDHLIEEIFEVLWQKTNSFLTTLRDSFTNKLLSNYIDQIEKVQKEVEVIYGEETFYYLKDVLVSAKTDIQNAIFKSINWFNISKTKSIGEIPISAIIMTSKEYLNTINANVFNSRITYSDNIQFTHNIKGDYFIILCDLFNTILGNVITHTKQIDSPKCHVSVFTENEHLTISTKNDYSKKYDPNQIREWKEILNGTDGNYYASFEGKSGFLKLKKILTNDLNFQDYKFNVMSNSEEFTFIISINYKNLIV